VGDKREGLVSKSRRFYGWSSSKIKDRPDASGPGELGKRRRGRKDQRENLNLPRVTPRPRRGKKEKARKFGRWLGLLATRKLNKQHAEKFSSGSFQEGKKKGINSQTVSLFLLGIGEREGEVGVHDQ